MISSRITALIAASTFIHTSIASYVLTDDYSKDAFYPHFTAFTGPDPTQGFVKYLDYSDATSQKLIGSVGNYDQASYIGVDYKSTTTKGRSSVRLTSKKSFNHGLFIADIAHMPGGLCGVWPAFWLVGPDWPKNGEIDIIEGVNAQKTNQMTLHTSSGCSISKTGFTGVVNTTNCDGNAPHQPKNAGCGIGTQNPASYGAGFNAAGGGVYATEWNSTAISIWFFPRPSVPADIASGKPDPSTWGAPMALFGGGACDIDAHFKDMQIVFDTTFCGSWAGQAWKQGECRTMAKTCEAHVGHAPGSFKEAYWLVNSVRVFAAKGG